MNVEKNMKSNSVEEQYSQPCFTPVLWVWWVLSGITQSFLVEQNSCSENSAEEQMPQITFLCNSTVRSHLAHGIAELCRLSWVTCAHLWAILQLASALRSQRHWGAAVGSSCCKCLRRGKHRRSGCGAEHCSKGKGDATRLYRNMRGKGVFRDDPWVPRKTRRMKNQYPHP